MDKDFSIPRTLDAPPLMFMWDADNAVLFILFVFLGALMQLFIFGLLGAVLFTRIYMRIKEEGGKGLLVKMLYWYMPSDWVTKRHSSAIREYFGG